LIDEAIDIARSRLRDRRASMSEDEFKALKEVRRKLKKYALPT